MTEQTPTDDAEVGIFSIWFLRGALVLTCLVVLGFLLHATIGLFDGDSDPDSDTAVGDDADQGLADEVTGDSTDESPTSSSTSTPPSSTSEAPATTPTDPPDPDVNAELRAFVDEAIAFIEATRQRAFIERPVVEVVSVDAMTKIVLDDIRETLAEDPEASDASLAFARAIGFFGPTDEFLDVYEIFVSGGVLGVYLPDSDQLLVRSAGELIGVQVIFWDVTEREEAAARLHQGR